MANSAVASLQKFDFASKFPKGIELSKEVITLMEEKRRTKTALAFDEITLEGMKKSLSHILG
jgi:hypothetical protein